MDFSVKIEGLEELKRTNAKIVADVEEELNKALFASAQRVEGSAKRSIKDGKKTGKIYEYYYARNKKTGGLFPTRKRSDPHQASAPGEAPADDSGRLANSINSYINESKGHAFVIAGRGIVKYARYLEFGTRKIAARPFMFPALEKNKKWIRDRLAKAVRIAIKKSKK